MQDLPLNAASISGSDPPPGGRERVVIVAIGGFDPTGGAGLVRDLLTGRTLGARVCLVPTAWTDQAARTGVVSIEPREPRALAAAVAGAIAAAAAAGGSVAVKLGMMPNGVTAEAIREALAGFVGPVVFDPVLGASSGGALYVGDPGALLGLASRATVVTPNAIEAALLSGQAIIDDAEAATEAGRRLVAAGARAVLVKGGHLTGATAVDVLVTPTGVNLFAADRLSGPPVRGTGCALATAIAVALGRGRALVDAVSEAKLWLHQALGRALPVGDEWHLD